MLITEVDARRELAFLTGILTAAQKDIGLPDRKLASTLGVATNSVVDWGTGQDSPTAPHLIGWAMAAGLRLVIVNDAGTRVPCSLQRESGETSGVYELRKLTTVLCDVRNAYPPLSQLEVARRAGVSRVSLVHWERMRTPPRALSLIRWAMALDLSFRLARLRAPHQILPR